jgi:flagellar biosynthesis regulator FlbT
MLQDGYMRGDFEQRRDEYAKCVTEFLGEQPDGAALIAGIHRWILKGELYKALKSAKALVDLD